MGGEFVSGGVTVSAFGTVENKPGYYKVMGTGGKEYVVLHPIGYKMSRSMPSYKEAGKTTRVHAEVCSGPNDAPTFKVWAEDDAENPIESPSCNSAWGGVMSRSGKTVSVNGISKMGFLEPNIAAKILDLNQASDVVLVALNAHKEKKKGTTASPKAASVKEEKKVGEKRSRSAKKNDEEPEPKKTTVKAEKKPRTPAAKRSRETAEADDKGDSSKNEPAVKKSKKETKKPPVVVDVDSGDDDKPILAQLLKEKEAKPKGKQASAKADPKPKPKRASKSLQKKDSGDASILEMFLKKHKDGAEGDQTKPLEVSEVPEEQPEPEEVVQPVLDKSDNKKAKEQFDLDFADMDLPPELKSTKERQAYARFLWMYCSERSKKELLKKRGNGEAVAAAAAARKEAKAEKAKAPKKPKAKKGDAKESGSDDEKETAAASKPSPKGKRANGKKASKAPTPKPSPKRGKEADKDEEEA